MVIIENIDHFKISPCTQGTSGRVHSCMHICWRGCHGNTDMCRTLLSHLARLSLVSMVTTPAEMDNQWLHFADQIVDVAIRGSH